MLNIFSDFLSNRKQSVVLNGQTSSWAIITAGVSQEFILGSLLFLIYKNDLPDGLTFIVKLFADDKSLFSVANDINASAKKLNKELNKTNNWACKRKMNFNPDQSKLAQEVLFSGKLQKVSHPSCF